MFQKLKNIYHLFQAILANIVYGFPSRKLKVIGVTGTDGKTTTTHLIAHILNNAGKKTYFVSTVFASIGGEESDIGFHVTTPSSFALQKLLKRSADNNDEYFILETTSHALDQNRVWGIKYEVGTITNITHEHLDYHKLTKNIKN
jgi:UDP-N-acetylmuramoyl-L-alanyl-D-glutamate--2,6-diaminopimelate ligase